MPLIKQAPKIDISERLTSTANATEILLREDVKAFLQQANLKYLHWDTLRWQNLPEGVTAEFIWAALKLQRQIQLKSIPLFSINQRNFSYWLPDGVLHILSDIDRWADATISTQQPGLAPRERYSISSLMEEAIASSQLASGFRIYYSITQES